MLPKQQGLWRNISDDPTSLNEVQINDFLFCSVLADGLRREPDLEHLYVVTGIRNNCFLLLCLATGTYTVKRFQDIGERYYWHMKSPVVAPNGLTRPATATMVLRQ